VKKSKSRYKMEIGKKRREHLWKVLKRTGFYMMKCGLEKKTAIG